MKTLQEILPAEPHGDLALCGFFLREKFGYSATEAYETDQSRIIREGVVINRDTRKRFIRILLRVAQAHDGVSRAEKEFIRRFWRELFTLRGRDRASHPSRELQLA